MDSDSSFGANPGTSLTITGQISDTGQGHNLTKVGDGQIVFAYIGTPGAPGGNTYRGTTTINDGTLTIASPSSLGEGAIGGTIQGGQPGSETIVNYNATTGVAGTLQMDFTGLEPNDPNGVLQNPALPYNAVTNPYIGFQVFNELLVLNGPGFNGLGALNNFNGENIWGGNVILGSVAAVNSPVSIGAYGPTPADPNTDLNVEGILSDPNRQPELDINGTNLATPPSPPTNPLVIGRVILSNDNTYTGNTFVIQGELNVRDSHALGANPTDPTPGGAVTVDAPATLELQVDSGLDGTGTTVGVNTHGRNLGFDTLADPGPGDLITVAAAADAPFDITFNGATTAALPFNATAAAVQTALSNLATIGAGNVSVTKNGNVYTAVFTGALAGLAEPVMTAAGPVPAPPSLPVSSLFEQEVDVTGTAGMFTLTFSNPLGVSQTTVSLPFNASASAVQTALANLTSIGAGNVSVTQDGSIYRVVFTGTLAGVNETLLTAAGVNGTTAVVNPVYGLTIEKFVTVNANGVLNALGQSVGAIHSISGINTWNGGILLNGTAGIGADLDSRPGHPTADNSYFTNDYSLTVGGAGITQPPIPPPVGNLETFDSGQVILTTANTYTGTTTINDGWVTIQDPAAFGPDSRRDPGRRAVRDDRGRGRPPSQAPGPGHFFQREHQLRNLRRQLCRRWNPRAGLRASLRHDQRPGRDREPGRGQHPQWGHRALRHGRVRRRTGLPPHQHRQPAESAHHHGRGRNR